MENEEVSRCVKFIERNIEPNTLELFKQARPTGVWTGDEQNQNFFTFRLKPFTTMIFQGITQK